MDAFSIAVVAMGCIVTAMLLIGFLREILRARSGRSADAHDRAGGR